MAVTQFREGPSDVDKLTSTLFGLAQLRQRTDIAEMEDRRIRDVEKAMGKYRYARLQVDMKMAESIVETRNLRSQVDALRTHISVSDAMNRQRAAILKDIDSEIGAIYGTKDLPADMKILFGKEMKDTLSSIASGEFDPNTMRDPTEIRMNMAEEMSKERDRVLELELGKEKREEEAKARGFREKEALSYEVTKEKYEYGSLLETETARENLQRAPEVRYVYYDPAGWGVRERKGPTGLRIPPAYQGAGYKLMTEKRAKELDVHDEWLAAGDKAIDLGKTSVQDLLKE